MKLRIKGNSVRLRLLRSEVERLVADGSVTDAAAFGPAETLRYSVECDPKIDNVGATFDDRGIVVRLPLDLARRWASGDEVSIGYAQPTGAADRDLEILVEKDFVCKDRLDDPDNADAFPNPKAPCA